MKKGDFIAIKENVYFDFPGGAWLNHFGIKKTFYVLTDMPTNNGNVIIKDCHGRKRWFNVNVQTYEVIKKGA